jgi:hypothetical protein
LAASLPALILLSFAATARNIYLAPALPGFALLVAWWAREILPGPDRWDVGALRGTAAVLLVALTVFVLALTLLAISGWHTMQSPMLFVAISLAGLIGAGMLAIRAWATARSQVVQAQWCLLGAYCALLIGPASQVYRQVDAWQDLATISHAIQRDAADRPLVLLAPDETTRAMIDMYARTSVGLLMGPVDSALIDRVRAAAAASPSSAFLLLLPRRSLSVATLLGGAPADDADVLPPWIATAQLRLTRRYSLPNGRHYALLQAQP